MRARRRPEILAPAGSPACLPAAVAGGADAVYLGLRHFNARGRAENFRRAELPAHVAWLHRHGLKCYVVMNTLIHDDEYAKALETAAAAHDAGVDAVILQDLGLWTVLARELPGLERHASTQMTVHDPAQVAVLARLGAERVILARELTLDEVRACTDEAARHGVETEHFVHGALCYAFSGQCLMSNFAGCRSANRGTCAQNCRFDYVGSTPGGRAPAAPAEAVPGGQAEGRWRGEMIPPPGTPGGRAPAAPAEAVQENKPDTVLSMKDLSLLAHIPALAEAGVASFKIEGRLKGPDYVYTTSRVYRAAADAWVAGERFDLRQARDLLQDVFSRGHTDAPLVGAYGQPSRLHRYAPERDRRPDATLARFDRAQGRADLLATQAPQAGQGYAWAHDGHTGGFLITAIDPAGPGRWRCRVRTATHGPRLPEGLPLFRNADHERRREAEAAMAAVPLTTDDAVALDLTVRADGETLIAVALTADGRGAEVRCDEPIAEAQAAPIDDATVRATLGAFGGSGFALRRLELALPAQAFVRGAALKRLRRALVEALQAQPAAERVPAVPAWRPPEPGVPRRRLAQLWVAVGDAEAGRAARDAGAAQVWLDDAALDLWASAPPRLDAWAALRDALWLRHPATARVSPHLAALGLPVVAGQLGALVAARAAGLATIADHPCNVFSSATLAALGALGASAAVISLECSCREIARLAARCGVGDWPGFAVVAHGRVPAMLTRQDHALAVGETRAIAAVERDGGLPYELTRRAGGDTVIWEGRRLACPEQVRPMATLVDGWVLECADLAPAAVAEVVGAYAALRDGRLEPDAVAVIAARHAPHGLFPGHLAQGSRELDLVLGRLDGEPTPQA